MSISPFCRAWKTGLTSALLSLDENMDTLYKLIGVNSNKIISRGDDEEYLVLPSKTDFDSIINEHLSRINIAAHKICDSLKIKTDFDLPIPVLVLLRVAAKVGLLRCKDYEKKHNNLIRSHVYSLTPQLIEINLIMFQSIITVLGTNIVPFTSYINQTVMGILEWTRTSNLAKYDENLYYSLRSKLLNLISLTAKQLSLNINFEPQLLRSLIEVELVDSLEGLTDSSSEKKTNIQSKYITDALSCLRILIIIYSELLDASLEHKVKSYVVQSCLKIYRDFKPNVMSLTCRQHLLQLLQTIANQPYATSTTEISHHIIELVMKVESDPELVYACKQSLKVGFTHRPVIVSHLDAHNYQFNLGSHEVKENGEQREAEGEEKEEEKVFEEEKAEEKVVEEEKAEEKVAEEEKAKEQEKEKEKGEEKEVQEEKKEIEVEEESGDEEVLLMLDSFVNKLA